jgi:hypothetical protein
VRRRRKARVRITQEIEGGKREKEGRRAGFVNQGKKEEGAFSLAHRHTKLCKGLFCLWGYSPSKEEKRYLIFSCVYV